MSGKDLEKNEVEMDVDDADIDLDDEEMDEELALPSVLSDISNNEKRELLKFKRSHNERDWEEEILRRTDLLARKVDLERLKKMTKGFALEPPVSSVKATKKTTPRGKRGKIESDEDEDEGGYENKRRRAAATKPSAKASESEEEEGRVSEDEEVDSGAADDFEEDDDDDDDDELFDSDEEEAISKRYAAADDEGEDRDAQGAADGKKSKTLGKKKAAAAASKKESGPRRSGRRVPSRRDEDDDDEGDYGEDLSDGGEDDYKKSSSRRSGGKRVSKGRAGGGLRDLDDDIYEEGVASDEEEEDREDGREGRRRAEEVDTSPPATLESYLRIQSRRFAIERWLSEPYLEEVLVGSFVRLFIGEIEGQKVYRMCEVTAVDRNARQYRLPDNGKMVTVRMTVSLAGQERPKQKIDVVSNSRITPVEFKHYQDQVAAVIQRNGGQPVKGVCMLTENQVSARRQRQLKATRHVYTHTEIRAMVARNSGLNKSLVTEYSTAMESLRKKLDEARAEKDYEAIDAVQKTIDKLEAESARQREANERATRHHIEVNMRSRESNVQRDMAAGMRKRQEELEAAAKGKLGNAVLDPFLRRETRPKILWNTGTKLKNEQDKDNGTAVAPTAADTAKATAAAAATASKTTVPGGANQAANGANGSKLWYLQSGDTSMQEIRRKVRAKFGFDPYAAFLENPRERYLRKACASLPPPGSAARAQLRGSHRSLEEVVEQVRPQREAMQGEEEQEEAGEAMLVQ